MKMQRKEQYKDQLDDFSKVLNEKLKYHKMSVDEKCWEDINRQLQPKKRPIVWWFATVAAVAVIALLILVIPTNDSATKIAGSENLKEKDFKTLNVNNKTNSAIDSSNNKSISTHPSFAIGIKKSNKPTYNSTNKIDTIENQTNTNLDNTFAGNTNTKIEETDTNTSKNDSIKKMINSIFDMPNNELIVGVEKEKKNNNWLLAAAFSSGSQQSNQNNSRDRLFMNDLPVMQLASKSLMNETSENNILKAEDFSEINHLPPLSFGLVIRKNLSTRIGLESGLTYTYLTSRFEKKDAPIAKAKQELHYLGIPVNAVVYIWDNPRWNAYLSTGAMVEKGLSQSFTQEIYKNNTQISSDLKKSSINGVQWSLNGSIGVSFKITKSWNLYVEPRYSYSFDTDQPISIRTEHKHSIGVLGGLRYVLP